MDFGLLTKYWPMLIEGLGTTLSLCLIGWTGGLVFGVIIGGFAFTSRHIGNALNYCSFSLSSLPILIVMVWLHYPAQSLLGIVIDPFYTTAICITVYNALAVASLTEQTLREFPTRYIAVASNLGIPHSMQLTKIVFPILLRQLLPAILPQQVQVIHVTMFASLISVDELFRMGQRIIVREYDPVTLYSFLAIFYLALSLPLLLTARITKHRFTRELREV